MVAYQTPACNLLNVSQLEKADPNVQQT